MYSIIYCLHQVGYVFIVVCVTVCKIYEKVMDGF